jgi:hypothetical protein
MKSCTNAISSEPRYQRKRCTWKGKRAHTEEGGLRHGYAIATRTEIKLEGKCSGVRNLVTRNTVNIRIAKFKGDRRKNLARISRRPWPRKKSFNKHLKGMTLLLNPCQSIKEDIMWTTRWSFFLQKSNSQKIKSKKLKGNIQKMQKRFGEIAYNAARSEMLLPEDRGYLEVEGMERTYKITQQQLRKEVDITTAQKVCPSLKYIC